MKTLLLDLTTWDLVVDAAGNIAVASDPYARAQDVASALRTFLGEVFYDTSVGIPYFQLVLGKSPPVTLFQQLMVDTALTVDGVASADCTISAFEDRRVTGSVVFTDINGFTQTVGF